MKIKEFLPNATPEQKELYQEICELGSLEQAAYEKYDALQREIDGIHSRAKSRWGLQTMMVNAELELLADPLLPARNAAEQENVQAREKMGILFQKAVTELGMAHLGIIQRYYEHYVGEPMPTSYLTKKE